MVEVTPKPASSSQISYAKSLRDQGVKGIRGIPGWLPADEAPSDAQIEAMDSIGISELIDALKSRKPFKAKWYGNGSVNIIRKASARLMSVGVSNRHLVAETTTIEPALVKGLRAWVKKTFAAKPRYSSLPDLITHLKTLRDKDLNRFWEYLFYNKGLLPRGKGFDNVIEKLRTKLAGELKEAHTILDEDVGKIQYTLDAMTPGTASYAMDQRQSPEWTVLGFYQRVNPDDPFDAALKGYEDLVRENLPKVEDILSGKLLRAITAFLGKYADDQPFESDEILLEYDIGQVKLVYDGEPSRSLINRPEAANPRNLSDYIPYFLKAKALLDRKGLGDLWYGTIFVGCPKCGGENHLGKHFGVGAHYEIGRDRVVVFMEPKPFMAELLIHELGHRYYYKFMNSGDRARFDSYFKEVPAVSEYGATESGEDFAEVFAHFVMGRDMTRDQIERFKAFLAKKDRGRFAATRVAHRHLVADGGWTTVNPRSLTSEELDAIWDQFVSTYQKIGLTQSSIASMISDYDVWEVFYSDGKIIAFSAAKRTPFGAKLGLVGSDGTPEGKTAVKAYLGSVFKKPGRYGEVSHGVEHIAVKAGSPAVCSMNVEPVLKKSVDPLDDGIHYKRALGGVGVVTKLMVGKPRGIPTTSVNNPVCERPSPDSEARVAEKTPYQTDAVWEDYDDVDSHYACQIDLE